MEISGRIIAVLEARGGVSARTGNTWKMQDYVLETIESFPKRICFNVFGEDKINQFNIQQGMEVTVSFDINAREYQGRWYNDVRAWNVVPYSAGAPIGAPAAGAQPQPFAQPAPAQPAQPVAAQPAQPAPAQPAAQNDFVGDDNGNLPF